MYEIKDITKLNPVGTSIIIKVKGTIKRKHVLDKDATKHIVTNYVKVLSIGSLVEHYKPEDKVLLKSKPYTLEGLSVLNKPDLFTIQELIKEANRNVQFDLTKNQNEDIEIITYFACTSQDLIGIINE